MNDNAIEHSIAKCVIKVCFYLASYNAFFCYIVVSLSLAVQIYTKFVEPVLWMAALALFPGHSHLQYLIACSIYEIQLTVVGICPINYHQVHIQQVYVSFPKMSKAQHFHVWRTLSDGSNVKMVVASCIIIWNVWNACLLVTGHSVIWLVYKYL